MSEDIAYTKTVEVEAELRGYDGMPYAVTAQIELQYTAGLELMGTNPVDHFADYLEYHNFAITDIMIDGVKHPVFPEELFPKAECERFWRIVEAKEIESA